MQQSLLSEIRKLTHEISEDQPHLGRLLKDIPGPGTDPGCMHEAQLREHLTGLKVMLENYKRR